MGRRRAYGQTTVVIVYHEEGLRGERRKGCRGGGEGGAGQLDIRDRRFIRWRGGHHHRKTTSINCIAAHLLGFLGIRWEDI